MRNCIKRFLISMLCISLIISVAPISSAASSFYSVYVKANSNIVDAPYWIELLIDHNTPYIGQNDIEKLTDFVAVDKSFTKGSYSVSVKNCSKKKKDNKTYYELRSIMDILETAYFYDTSTETLNFVVKQHHAKEMMEICSDAMFSNAYSLEYLTVGFSNKLAIALASTYNIIAGFRLDALWGNYSLEQYNTALAGIMNSEEDYGSLLEVIEDGNSLASKLNKLYKYGSEYIDKTPTNIEVFGETADEIFKAYGVLNSTRLGLSDFIDIAVKANNGEHAARIYVDAVKYGIIEYVGNDGSKLASAASTTYKYYNTNIPKYNAVLSDLYQTWLTKSAEEGIKKTIKEFLKEQGVDGLLPINSTYIAIEKLILDEFMGMKESTKATEQIMPCADIQNAALNAFYHYYFTFRNDTMCSQDYVLGMKYSTILYFRTCQYAYSLWEYDSEMADVSSYWKTKTDEIIRKLAEFSDDEITADVANDPLDYRAEGFCSEDEYKEIIRVENAVSQIIGISALYIWEPFLNNAPIYKVDIDSDGVDDYISLDNNQKAVFSLAGAGPVTCGLDGANGNGSIRCYMSKQGGVYCSFEKSTPMSSYSELFCFPGNIRTTLCLAVKEDTLQLSDDGYTWLPTSYSLEGHEANQAEYARYIDKLTLSPIETASKPIDISNLPLAVYSTDFHAIANQIARNPLYSLRFQDDLDGDGKDDYVFITNWEDNPVWSSSVVIHQYWSYNYDDASTHCWDNCAVWLFSNNGAPRVQLSDKESLQENSSSTDTLYSLQDGLHLATLYLNGITEESGGWLVNVDFKEPICFSDERIAALKIGDEIVGESVQDIYDDYICLEINQIRRVGTQGKEWILCWPSDIPITEVVQSGTIFIPSSVVFTDELALAWQPNPAIMKSPWDLFIINNGRTQDTMDVEMEVQNGAVAAIHRFYRP